MRTPRKVKRGHRHRGPGSGRLSAGTHAGGAIVPAWLQMVLAATVLGGCADPDGKFDEFDDAMANRPASEVTDCGSERVEAVTGTFFTALATDLDPSKPVVALAEITTDAAGMHVVLQPLRADDRETPVGEPIAFPAAPLSPDGEFSLERDEVVVPEEGNPLGRGHIEMPHVTLRGTACEQLVCGDWWGLVTAPIDWELQADLSHFAMIRLDPGQAPPEPPRINCAGDLAGPIE